MIDKIDFLGFFVNCSGLIKKLQPGEDQIGSLLFDIQSNENSRFKIFKVPEAKSISLNDFDEVICGLKFCV